MGRKTSRSLWTAKLTGGSVPAAQSLLPGAREPYSGIILGIDPSLRGMGLSAVAFEKKHTPRLCQSQTLRLPASISMPNCLGRILMAVQAFLDKWEICAVSAEQTIYVQNFRTAQILGAARGAALAGAAARGIPIFEYPPLRIKQAVVGVGRASKEQVARTVASILNTTQVLPYDESDAAAAAICHAFTWRKENN